MSRQSWIHMICVVGTLLALGCAGPTPEVSAADRSSAQTLRYQSPVAFQTKSAACNYAVEKARQQAGRTCSVASLSVDRDSCQCSRSSAWGCSVEAVYTCE